MNKTLKYLIATLVVAIIVVLVSAAQHGQTQQNLALNPNTETKVDNAIPSNQSSTSRPNNNPTITKAEFEQTQNGMTPEQVALIVGGPGEMVADLGIPGTRGYTVTYKYTGEGSLGAKASMMFQNGKLYMKAQYGLK